MSFELARLFSANGASSFRRACCFAVIVLLGFTVFGVANGAYRFFRAGSRSSAMSGKLGSSAAVAYVPVVSVARSPLRTVAVEGYFARQRFESGLFLCFRKVVAAFLAEIVRRNTRFEFVNRMDLCHLGDQIAVFMICCKLSFACFPSIEIFYSVLASRVDVVLTAFSALIIFGVSVDFARGHLSALLDTVLANVAVYVQVTAVNNEIEHIIVLMVNNHGNALACVGGKIQDNLAPPLR